MFLLLNHLACSSAEAPDATDSGEPAALDTAETGDTAAVEFYSADTITAIQKAVRKDLNNGYATGAQIAVWHAGKLVYVASFGSKDPDDATALVDDATVFQIGSDTKKITAVAALQQVEAGNLSLDSTVAEIDPVVDLAASPDWAHDVTLRQLISHQGGLVDYTPWEEDKDDSRLANIAEGSFSANAWAMSDPGACWNYANPNFSIAGLLTEKVDGRAWPDVVEEDVFAPMGLTHTFARRDEATSEGNFAIGTGYTITDSDPFDPWNTPTATFGTVPISLTVDNAFTRPAGMVWSTASDMATWGSFFVHGDPTILSDELRALTTTPQVRLYPAWDAESYGMGWILVDWISTYDGVYLTPFWEHGGNTLSMTSLTWVFPEKDLSISILNNGYGTDFTETALVLLSGSGLFTDPQGSQPLPDTETDHAALIGTYRDHALGLLTVTDVDGVLNVDAPGFDAMGWSYDPELGFAGITDVYYLTAEGTNYDVTFITDEAGEYHWLRNREFVGERVEGLLPLDVTVTADPTAFWTDLTLAAAEPDRLRMPYGPYSR